MKWFKYLKKTPVAQIVVDLRGYVKLRKSLRRAEGDLVQSGSLVVRHYDMCDNINDGNACIKCKQLIDSLDWFSEEPAGCAHGSGAWGHRPR